MVSRTKDSQILNSSFSIGQKGMASQARYHRVDLSRTDSDNGDDLG